MSKVSQVRGVYLYPIITAYSTRSYYISKKSVVNKLRVRLLLTVYDFTCFCFWSPSAWSGCWLHAAEFHCAGLEQIISGLLPKAGLLGCDLWPRLSLHALWGWCPWKLSPGRSLNFEPHSFPCQPLIRATSNKLFDKHRNTMLISYIHFLKETQLYEAIEISIIFKNNRQKKLLIYVASKSVLHIDTFYAFK